MGAKSMPEHRSFLTYPEIDFLVFGPVSIASIVFGTLLILFSACIFALGAFLIIESRLKMM